MNDRSVPKILLVDDDPLIREYLKKKIQDSFDCCVVTASNGESGLEFFCAERFDIAIVDITLPCMNGFELLREIRKIDQSVPAIVFSGYVVSEKYVEAFNVGANCVISKDGNVEALINIVKDYLTNKIQIPQTSESPLSLEKIVRHKYFFSDESLEKLKSNFIDHELNIEMSEGNESQLKGAFPYKQFCHSVIHSLKGEFMKLGSSIHNLLSDDCISKSKDSWEEIIFLEESIQYCQLLSRRLIDYMDIGKPSLGAVNISAILEKAKLLLSPRIPPSISFTINISKDLPNFIVYTDPEEILMVLVELVGNAKKALSGRNGSILIQINSLENGSIQISVCDDGPGIPLDVQNYLFKQQVDSKSGTGFGLYLTHKVIESLGGEMSLKSSSENGTVISIVLPVRFSNEERSE